MAGARWHHGQPGGSRGSAAGADGQGSHKAASQALLDQCRKTAGQERANLTPPGITKDGGLGQAKCLPGPGNYDVDKRQVNEGESEVSINEHAPHTHAGALGEE